MAPAAAAGAAAAATGAAEASPSPIAFRTISYLKYAGNGLWSSEEDIYNPRRDAARVVGAWLAAGGELATDQIPSPKHG